MAKINVEEFRKILNALSARLSGEVAGLRCEALGIESDTETESSSLEQSDMASHMTEEDRTLILLGNEQNILDDVRAALDRIDCGTFGLCQDCEKAINQRRLEAIPYTRYCVTCANRREKLASLATAVD